MKIAVASGKGGTGKTFVSTNLFWVARQEGIPVTLVDCDAEEPDVNEFISGNMLQVVDVTQHIPVIHSEQCTYCGACYDYCNYQAILFFPENNYIQVLPDLCHDCGACTVACKYGAIREKEKLLGKVRLFFVDDHARVIEGRTEVGVYSPVPVIRRAIREAADDQPLILIDSPPGIACPFIAAVDQADFVVLVAEPTPFGLNDLKLSAETLREIGKTFGVVVNRAGLGNRELYRWMEENQVPLLAEFPFDREVARVYSEGHLIAGENAVYYERFNVLLKNIEKQIGSWSKLSC